jgi:Ca-activated chloride channel family protein
MKFANPDAFWMLLALPVLAVLWIAASSKARAQVQRLVAARLQGLLVGEALGRKWRWALLCLGLALGIGAWARPQLGQSTSETRGRGRDVIIMVDVSRSMLATDIPPSRLQRAKLAAEDLVRQLPGDRVGLVAFAGSAFLQAPVTADHSAVLTAMRELDPELIPLPGTNISAGLQCVDEAFDRTEGGQRAVVLITDGEDLEADSVALARELSGKMRLFTVGVGSPEGTVLMVPSPRGGTEYIRDETGGVVQSKLDEARLQELAVAGGGFYTRLVSGPAEMRRIAVEGIGSMEEHDVQVQSRTRPIERYQWPLAAALLSVGAALLAGEGVRRKGTLAAGVAVLGMLALFATPAEAAVSGKTLYEGGDYAGAQKAFTEELGGRGDSALRAFNLGTAAYKNQKWPEAIEAFGKALASSDPEIRTKAEYNLANTLVQQARQGRRGQDNTALEQAVSHYEEALRRKGDFEEAQYNRDFVKKLLLEKEKQQQQKQKGGGDKSQKDKKEEQEKDKDKEKDPSEQDKQEGDAKDGEKKDGEGQDQDGKGQKQSKDGQAKNGDKPGEGKNAKNGKDGKDTAQNGQTPEPVEEKAGEQKERGELKDSPLVDKPDGNKDGKEQQAQAMQSGPAKMTREQAAALMEALRSEDRRVQVWAPGKQEQAREGARSQKTW